MTDFPEVFEARQAPEWATFCPARKPAFKVHTSEALANSSIANHKPQWEIALYHLEVEEGAVVWKKVWEYVKPDCCEWCGGPFRYNPSLPYNDEGRVKDAPLVCDRWRARKRQELVEKKVRKNDLKQLEELRRRYPDA